MIPRVVSFGGSSVRIDCRGDKAVEIADFLYGDLPAYEGPTAHVALEVRADPEPQKLIVRVGKAVYYRGDSLGRLASALMRRTMTRARGDCSFMPRLSRVVRAAFCSRESPARASPP